MKATLKRKLTKNDLMPDTTLPSSIREIVQQEMSYTTYNGKTSNPFELESMEDIMKRVYAQIEKEALAKYHSAAPWALKAWTLSNILKEQVADEVSDELAHNLISPVMEWQKEQPADPVSNYHEKLVADGKPPPSVRQFMGSVTKFVARKGRKSTYPEGDIIEHMAWLRENGYTKRIKNRKTGDVTFSPAKYTQASLRNEHVTLQQFFRFLHKNKAWEMPLARVRMPTADELYQPILSHEEVEKMIVATIIDKVPASWIVRFAIATLYGPRVSELTDVEVNLDGKNSTIFIKTRKHGQRRPQPILPSLLPIFAGPIEPMKQWKLSYIFQSLASKAGVDLPDRGSWHSLRRRCATDVYEETLAKDISVSNFFRWRGRGIGQLPTYVKIPMQDSDMKILNEHPYRDIWETMVPLLMEFHPDYINCTQAQKIFHTLKTPV
jgi:hypothetical protein